MDATKSYIKVYGISPEAAEDFEFDYTVDGSEILAELVPDQSAWGELTWGIEFEEYEYSPGSQVLYLTLNTKWESPVEWLKNASKGTHYFENKLGCTGPWLVGLWKGYMLFWFQGDILLGLEEDSGVLTCVLVF